MHTDLAQHIASLRVVDTHEHMRSEEQWLNQGPADVLDDLFYNYLRGDLVSAGMDVGQSETMASQGSIDQRWDAIKPFWEHCQYTGYGEAVRMMAKANYDIDEITLDAMVAAQPKLAAMRKPGERYRILRDLANLDHVQVDNFIQDCSVDPSGPDFFRYDLSFATFCKSFTIGDFDFHRLTDDTGITVKDLATFQQAIEATFAKHAPNAIAVKSQHAYLRTLHWQPRTDVDAERALLAFLQDPQSVDAQGRLCIEDWCLAHGCRLAGEYDLPFKIHCGHYAGNSRMQTDRINAGKLCPLLEAYPDTRFVLMHIAYPYYEELIAIIKHYQNAYADLCWAWSINPHASMQFVRSFLHAAPVNKLFAFGGDCIWSTQAYGYALQMRKWLTKTLQAEVDDGELSETQAMAVAEKVLFGNQIDCFEFVDLIE